MKNQKIDFTNYDSLPKRLKEAVFVRHSHADLFDSSTIVYTEKSVLELMEMCYIQGLNDGIKTMQK